MNKRQTSWAALSTLAFLFAAVVATRVQHRRKLKNLWHEATTSVGINGSTPATAHTH